MASATVSWGIEVGASSIKAMKLEATGDGLARVLDYAAIAHPKPLSTPGVDANEVIRVSLGQLTTQYDLTKASIAVSVPGHSAFARFAKLPPVEPKKVPDIVRFEAMQQIPFPLEQVEWDYQTFVTPDSPEIEVGIFAMHRDRVMERLTMLQEVGIVPDHVVLSPIAVYNALAYDLQFDTSSPGTIIVDVGTTSTDLVVATPGRVWVRTFPIGGHQFTEALVNQFQITYAKAEKLKREAEDTKHARQVFQAMRPVFTDLAQDIQRSIGYFQSLNRDASLTRLIGVGSTFELPGLRKYLKQQLSLDVYRIEQFKRLSVDGEREQAFQTASLNLCTCYGLALQGLGMNTVGGNLMPVSVVRDSMWKEKVPWFGLAAGLAVAGSVGMFARPWLDKMAIAAKPPGPIISQVVTRFNDAKKRADDAGVLDSGAPDLRAANAVLLLENREILQLVHQDMVQLFTAANAKAAGWPASVKAKNADGSDMTDVPGSAFSLLTFETDYQPPASADPNAPSEEVKDPLQIAALPKIRCELEVSTQQPEIRRFMQLVMTQWLTDVRRNSPREGVPYVVKAEDVAFRILSNDSTGAGGGRGASPRREGPQGGGPGRMGAESRRGLPPGAGVMFDPAARREDRQTREARARQGPVIGGPATGDGDGGATAAADRAKAMGELEALAPLVIPEAPEGTRVVISWYAVFVPVDAAAAAGGPQ